KVIAPVLTAVKPADNLPNPRNNGAIALTTPPTNIAILPNAVSNGPPATATAENIPIIFFCSSLKLVNHRTPVRTLSTLLVNTCPIVSPASAAHVLNVASRDKSRDSRLDSLDCSYTRIDIGSPSIAM